MRKIFVILFASLFIFACKKSSDIGGNILPADDLLNAQFSDTATVLTKTVYDEAQRTDKMLANFLGLINDSKLGISKASLVAELYPPSNVPIDSLAPFTLDSAVLFLNYVSYYGDTSVPQTFSVNVINNKINENNPYFSNESSFMGVNEIGRVDNYKLSPSQKVHTTTSDTSGTAAIIRIPLYNSFGNDILSQISDTTLEDSLAFKNYLPGIIIQNEGTSGACMVQLSVTDINTKVAFFFRDRLNNKIEMDMFLTKLVIINGSLVSIDNTINLFNKDYSSTSIPSVVSSAAVSDSVNYVLGQAGLLTKVSFPNLTNFGRVAVNKAVLEVTQYEPNGNSKLIAPSNLYLSRKNSSGDYTSLQSYAVVAFATKDSSYTDPLGGKYIKYFFNITGYVQDVLFGRETNTDIYINTHLHPDKTASSNGLSAFGYSPAGVILGGSTLSDPKVKAKLKLTYSPVK